jgi:hypothetical protein
LENIPDSAFEKTSILSVIIPDSVTTIGNDAFYQTPLTSVTIPDSVTEIGPYAFYNTPLTSVTIPDSVTAIGDHAFYNTLLTSVIIPDSVTTIGGYAFLDTLLTSVIIPDSVTTIGDNAFSGTPLTSVIIPDSVITIEYNVFYHCPFQTIKINCNTSSNNNIVTILGNMAGPYGCKTTNIDTLRVALSPTIAAKPRADLLNYVKGILAIDSQDNAIINAILEHLGIFELDLSNTDLTQVDIDNMTTKTLPWIVIFKNGETKTYSA